MNAVGFIGLGTMGSRMARNLLQAGYPVVVYDASSEAAAAMADAGATPVSSPADVARRANIVHLSLPDSPQVMEVALGTDGLAAGVSTELVVLDHSTVAPATSRYLAAELLPRGITWLDAPVSGGPGGAAAGSLTIMIGGDEAEFEKARPTLEVLGGSIEYMGGSGAGTTTKVINNFALGVHIIAMAEALTLGRAAGIETSRLIDVMRTSSANCWILENVIPRVVLSNRLEEEPAPWFALSLMHKDVRLAVAAASDLNVPVAVGSLVEQTFAMAVGQGWEKRDHLAILKLYADYVGIREW